MSFKRLLVILLTALLILSFTVSSPCQEEPTHFTGFKKIRAASKYAGRVTINGTDAVDGEDEIGVFVRDDSNGEMLIGACVMGQTVGGYYFVAAYEDDPTTIEKDGAYDGEELMFKVWDKDEDKEYNVPPSFGYMFYEEDTEEDPNLKLLQPSIPPIWENGKLIGFGFLNLAPPITPGDIDGSGSVDLKDIIAVLQSLTGTEMEGRVYKDADINEDGKINMEEALHLLQLVADTE